MFFHCHTLLKIQANISLNTTDLWTTPQTGYVWVFYSGFDVGLEEGVLSKSLSVFGTVLIAGIAFSPSTSGYITEIGNPF